MSTGGNFLHGRAIAAQLDLRGVEVRCNTKVTGIDGGGVRCQAPEGERYYEAATVVYAVGQNPLMEEAAALHGCARRFYPLGDCLAPRSIGEATAAAATYRKRYRAVLTPHVIGNEYTKTIPPQRKTGAVAKTA